MGRVMRWVGVVGAAAVALVAPARAGAAPTADGRVVYSNNAIAPQHRAYSASSNTFGSAASMPTGAAQRFIVDRAAPTRDEHLAGYVTSGGVLYVLRWNGSAWTSEWNVTVGGTGVNGRRFDIAYENASGDAIVLYSANAAGANELRYRVWNGSAWTPATNLDVARITGTPNWVKLTSRRAAGSDVIAAAIADTNGDLTAIRWSGTGWGNEPSVALETNLQQATTVGDKDSFDIAVENASGDVFVVYSNGTPQQLYARLVGTTWTVDQSLNTGTQRTIQSMFAQADTDPASDRVVVGWDRTGSANRYGIVWNGSALGTLTTIGSNASTTIPASSHQMTGAWLTSGTSKRAVVVYQSTSSSQIDFAYFNDSSGTWTTGQAAAGFASGTWSWVDMDVDPRSPDTLMLTFSDSNGDLWAVRSVFNGSSLSWTSGNGGTALTTTLASTASQNFSFAYDRFSNSIQLVTGTDPAGNTAVCPGATVYADQFGFTVVGAADTVTAVTASGLGATPGVSSIELRDGAGASFAPPKTCTPAGDTCTFSATGLSTPIGTTNFTLYATAKPQGSGNLSFTPIVGSYAATNTQLAGTDTANAFTIDDTAEAVPTGFSAVQGTPASSTLDLSWTGTAAWYVVYAIKGSVAPGDTVTDGTDVPGPAGSPHPTNSWLAYAGSSTSASITGLDPSSTYTFEIFARDACINWSTAATAQGTTGAPPQFVTVGNGSLVIPAVIPPGAAGWTPVDSFDVTVTSGTPGGNLTGVTFVARTGTSQYLAGVRIARASDGMVLGTLATPSGEAWSVSLTTADPLSTTTQNYRVEVQPKTHAQIDALYPVPGGLITLAPGSGAAGGIVTAVTASAGATFSYVDGSLPDPSVGTVDIDNESPAEVTGVGAIGGGLLATVSWTNPASADLDKVVVCKKTTAFAAGDRPAEGANPAVNDACGAATVAYAGSVSPQVLSLTAGTWYFKLFSRDTSGNFASGVASASVIVENFQSSGDLTPYSNKPVISIINPKSNAVLTLPAKVQVRAYSSTAGGALVPADTVNLVVGGVSHALGSTARNASYAPSSPTAGVWEYTIPAGAFAAGASVELRANATNAAGGPLYSERVSVRISAGKGDGNLLVRDNSAQLCSDCHSGVKTHSAEGAGNKHGSWSTTCRDCHTPHSTTNIGLVKTTIKPPEVNGTTTAVTVDFRSRTTGYGTSAFASGANNGPCQVCHTRTDFYLKTGLDGDGSVSGNATTGHNPSAPCTTCHLHTKGLGASCTQCHGTEGRASIGGADLRQAAAPPAVAADAAVKITTNNAHLAHVNEANLRAAPLACVECHATMKHQATHQVDMGYGTIATGGGRVTGAQLSPPEGALQAGFQTTPTCTNYCHSDAKPVEKASASFPATLPRWDAGNTGTVLGCTACHGNGTAGLALSAAHTKHISAGTYGLTCDECHASVVANDQTATLVADHSAHVDGERSLQFSTTFKTVVPPIDNSGGFYGGAPSYTCSGTYCHSKGLVTAGFNPPADPNLSWNGGTSNCGSCHPTPMASNAHPGHVASPATGSYGCQTCHVSTTANGTSIASYSLHVNGAKDLSGGAYGTWDSGAKTCSTNQCHWSGNAAIGGYVLMDWDSGTTLDCNGCHGRTTSAGAPDYASGAAGSATANSHLAHTGNGAVSTSCVKCHSGFVNDAGDAIVGGSHTNGTPNVSLAGGGTYTPGVGNKTCGNTGGSCHGTSTVQWGGPKQTCSSCHQHATLDTASWNITDGNKSYIKTSEWTGVGHGQTTGFDEFGAATDRCLYCHDPGSAHGDGSNPFRLRGAADSVGVTGAFSAGSARKGNDVCLNCHDTSNTVAYGVDPAGTDPRVCQAAGANPCDKRVDATHYGKRHGAGNDGGQRCWDCHDPHGDGTNMHMVASDALPESSDDYGLAGNRVTITFISDAAGGYAKTTAPYDGVCQSCHTGTKFWKSDGSSITHFPSDDCTTTCHTHQNPVTNAFKGNGDCTQCHNTSQPMAAGGSRRVITTEFNPGGTNNGWSHKRSGSYTATKWDCIVCHAEGDASDTVDGGLSDFHGDGVINLRDPDTGDNIKVPTFVAAGGASPGYFDTNLTAAPDATFTRFSRSLADPLEAEPTATRDALFAQQVNFCLKCHDGDGAAMFAAGGKFEALAAARGFTAGKPFGTTISGTGYAGSTGNTACASGTDGCVVNVARSFATTNASYHPILGKQNNSFTPATRMYAPWNSVTGKTSSTSLTEWGLLISCWDCHAPNGTASNVVLSQTVTAHGGATTARGDPWANPSGLCKLCHNPYVGTSSSHGTGSAFNSSTNSGMTTYIQNRCNYCHFSGTVRAARPQPGEDAHGFDLFAPTAGAGDTMWPVGATNTYRPYAFMRNVGTGATGNWRTISWRPRSATGELTAGTSTCGGSSTSVTGCTGENMGSYTPGGNY